jgi:hypothetical protein
MTTRLCSDLPGTCPVGVTVRIVGLLAAQAVVLGCASAAGSDAPPPLNRIGVSEKVCQLTGDVDWGTGRPTAARTFANAGLDATDLGYPVEHAGKLFLLFGDSWPPDHGHLPPDVPPDDAVGVTIRKDPPGSDGKCLELEVHHNPSGRKTFAPSRIVGPAPVKQGFFNVPSGGVSVAGGLFAFFWTDHCANPHPLLPSPGHPLGRPPAGQGCPETDDSNSIGRGVLARSDDEGRTFHDVVPLPRGFVCATAVNSRFEPDLPTDQKLGVFIFAAPRYRASVPYLAYAPVESLANPDTWRFFTGLSADGKPKWVARPQWRQSTPNLLAPAEWNAPGQAEVFAPGTNAERCIGEFSVTWNRPLQLWLMLYSCKGSGTPSIEARTAPAPWGPWSEPTLLLSHADDLGCRLWMAPDGCANRRSFFPKQPNGKFLSGLYAPFVLNRYTTPADGHGRRATIYWLLSTWNPYEVTVMRTTLEARQ